VTNVFAGAAKTEGLKDGNRHKTQRKGGHLSKKKCSKGKKKNKKRKLRREKNPTFVEREKQGLNQPRRDEKRQKGGTNRRGLGVCGYTQVTSKNLKERCGGEDNGKEDVA